MRVRRLLRSRGRVRLLMEVSERGTNWNGRQLLGVRRAVVVAACSDGGVCFLCCLWVKRKFLSLSKQKGLQGRAASFRGRVESCGWVGWDDFLCERKLLLY